MINLKRAVVSASDVLSSLEFSSSGNVKRYPTEKAVDAASQALTLAKQHKTEDKHIRWFVTGALHECLRDTHQKIEGDYFQAYLRETMHVVNLYLKGKIELDGNLFAFQCEIAAEAMKLFGPTNL